ncbi:MAG: DUF1569 domain-containing protein [Phycisphaeraceae bacterium]|nr:DUF1569 domain-containing protein [Phycisphaeraceae bacterium]
MAAQKTPKELKAAPRRALRYDSLDDLSRDLDAIEAGHRAGTLVTSGNWTPGENLHHCAKTWLLSIDGFPPDAKPPAIVKFVVKTFFKKMAVSGKPAPIGIKFPKGLEDAFGPKIGASFDEGMSAMRAAVGRVRSGERFTHASPLFGPLTHDEWLRLQLGHCSMHLSFLHPEGLPR